MRQLSLCVLLALAGAAPAAAVPAKPQITDAKGDAVALGPSYDVVSARFANTPTKLTVTVTYAAAPGTDPYAAQVVSFDVPGCGQVYLETYGGGTYGDAACRDPYDFSAAVSGRTLTISLPFTLIGKKLLKRGARLTALRTYTAVADPVLGYESMEATEGRLAVDDATTAATYVIS